MLPCNLIRTTLSSTSRQTTRECVCLVRRGHFRSRDKDGGHAIRSAIAENALLHEILYGCILKPNLLFCFYLMYTHVRYHNKY